MTTSKLRIALRDNPEDIEFVRTKVEADTGMVLEPEFQEIDTTQLIVELRVAGAGGHGRDHLAEAVGGSVPEVDVLSTWHELPSTNGPGRPAFDAVVVVPTADAPEAVHRSLCSGIPTAMWCASRPGDDRTGLGSGWLLSVPLDHGGISPVTALARRRGYSIRFSAHDADAVRHQYAAPEGGPKAS